mgnify:CR=1 FL=1|jgi:hypothetical protein
MGMVDVRYFSTKTRLSSDLRRWCIENPRKTQV